MNGDLVLQVGLAVTTVAALGVYVACYRKAVRPPMPGKRKLVELFIIVVAMGMVMGTCLGLIVAVAVGLIHI